MKVELKDEVEFEKSLLLNSHFYGSNVLVSLFMGDCLSGDLDHYGFTLFASDVITNTFISIVVTGFSRNHLIKVLIY